MHESVRLWVGKVVANYGLADMPTLEVGSQIVNGTVKGWFHGPYFGVDMVPGLGVDKIVDAEKLYDMLAPGERWPVVVSTEMLEHCPRPWVAVAEMAKVCAPGGHVILTARGYDERGCWELHSYPFDFWRFSEGSMRLLATDAGLEVLSCEVDPEGPGWMLVATKPT